MKAIFSFFTLFTFAVTGQHMAQGIDLKSGSVLVYRVDYFGTQYDFIMTLAEVGEKLSFHYVMTEPVGTDGTVIMTPTATKSATILYNSFSGGEVTLQDKTSAFVSKDIFTAISTTKKAAIQTEKGGADTYGNITVAKEKISVTGSLKDLSVYKLVQTQDNAGNNVDAGSAKEIRVLDNANLPLITYMDLGWTIQLTEVK